MPLITVDVPDGTDARVVMDQKRRLNARFAPLAIDGDRYLMIDRMLRMRASTQRLLAELLSMCSVTNRVVYWSTEINVREELCELVRLNVISRPTAAQHPRRKGFTTVLVNPHLVLTTDESMYELWDSTQPEGHVSSDDTAQ